MKMSLSKHEVVDFLAAQLKTFFPDKDETAESEIEKCINVIFERVEYCFSKVNNDYFKENGNVVFNHLHADQYAMFLYFAANTLYKKNADTVLCTKICQLNKYLHGIDAFYEVELPDIFLFVHPLGTVLGRANYSNYFLVYQRCGIGSNHGIYPTLEEYVSLHPGASVIGNCIIERNCKISADSLIMDKNLEENSIYIGNTLSYVIKKSQKKSAFWE
jgi:serine O-acetyltransferase